MENLEKEKSGDSAESACEKLCNRVGHHTPGKIFSLFTRFSIIQDMFTCGLHEEMRYKLTFSSL